MTVTETAYQPNCITVIQNSVSYAILFVLLALTGLASLLYEFLPFADPGLVIIARDVDFYIACVFFADFIMGMLFNNQGLSYRHYIRRNWLDLLASIPLTYEAARAFRILRIFKALRIIASTIHLVVSRRRYRNIKLGLNEQL